jgi:hypothetical protein
MESSSSIEAGAAQRRITARLPRNLRLSLIVCGVAIAVATVVSAFFETDLQPTAGGPQFVGVTAYFFQAQDARCLALIALLLIGFAVLPWPSWVPKPAAMTERRLWIIVFCAAIAVGIIGIVGTQLVFGGYHLARDEVLADFDAIIFRAGKILAPIDPAWRSFSNALEPCFMLPVAQGTGFASAYLPVNAALRAVVGLFGDRSWTSPILAVISVLATYGVGRRLWPSRQDAALVSVLLLATSSQLLVTAMTSYAMTAHLAFNLIWLWLFLRDDRIGHAGALATGFLACGLHQLIFHPLFAAPFILRLWVSGRRPLALVYIAAYTGFSFFWILYWKLVLQAIGMAPALADDVGSGYFAAKILVLLADFNAAGVDLMLKNLLRFVAWQGPALLPLAILAYPALKRDDGIARELLAGLLITLVAMFILLPYQGHGWGYRYVHGLLGSVAFLGGYGWIAVSDRASREERAASRTFLVISSLVASLVLFPMHATAAHDFVLPYRRAVQAIRQSPADVVVVDSAGTFAGQDLVRNDPFLRNRPKVLALDKMTAANIADLCAHDRIAFFDAGQARALGIMLNDKKKETPQHAELRALLKRSCRTEPVLKINGTQH